MKCLAGLLVLLAACGADESPGGADAALPDQTPTAIDIASASGDMPTAPPDIATAPGDLSTAPVDMTIPNGDLPVTPVDIATAQVDMAAAPGDLSQPGADMQGTTGTGRVALTQDLTGGGSYTASATFEPGGGVGGCTPTLSAGGCIGFSCPPNNNPAEDTAGTVTFSGGLLGAPITLTPNSMYHYPSMSGSGRAFNGGDLIRFQAAGASGGVGAFDQMVAGASDVTVTAPVFTTGTPLAIPRSASLVVSWTTASSPTGKISVSLYGPITGTSPFVGAICRYPLGTGSASIPASVLGTIPAGTGTIRITSENPVSIVAGAYLVELSPGSAAAASGGGAASSQASYQ
jgi:hypothetical protein